MSLVDKTPSESYKDLLTISRSNNGIADDGTLSSIEDGIGTTSGVKLSDRSLQVKSKTNNTTAFEVLNADDASKFSVDTTNNYVKSLGTHVNTQYATFGCADSLSTNWAADTHYPLAFSANSQISSVEDNMTLGTGTDPATTFTTADGSNTDASLVIPKLWYVPDNIVIDAVYSLEGGDHTTGATTKMHLFSYTFTSGSTSCLTSGTLLAQNGSVTNAGTPNAYKSTWTVDSGSVAGGKVIVATFLMTDNTGDYSASVFVKYHIV